MTLEVLLSCMDQQDTTLVHTSRLTGNVLIVNWCRCEETITNDSVRMLFTTQRGLTRSWNMAIRKAGRYLPALR